MDGAAAIPSPATCCQNCSAELRGAYCHQCGAREVGPEDLSTRHFVGEAIGEVTDIEHSKLLRTLGALLFRPGFLTLEYFSARRQRYLRPLAMCLAVFAISFFAFGAGGKVSIFDSARAARQETAAASMLPTPPEKMTAARVAATSRATGVSPAELYRRIDERWAANATLVQFPQFILVAVVLMLAHRRRYFVEHLVFSMHFISFQLLTVVLMWPLYYTFGMRFTGPMAVFVTLKHAVDAVYMFIALRRFYGGPLKRTLMRVPLIFGGYYFVYGLTYAAAMMFAINAVL